MSLHRKERLQSELRRTLSELICFEVQDPRIRAITLKGVTLTGDLKIARVYYEAGLEGDEKKKLRQALDRARGFLRREIARRLTLRVTPELQFYDEGN